ncbi:hypothetical protein GCM10010402_37850 [Actinomadura luteofluorescens]|uniref:hypothetical protein n=1 Tax=Actinomadura luteofluorescens TaxID=46163 RepID=UPI00216417AA|nr:hypothetical protein [Actinomadura glauciflava]MCR3745645.1 hypothetical protein [Actinomadura glauciflava]
MWYPVGQYLDQWLADHRGLRRSTRKSYGEHIEYYLKPIWATLTWIIYALRI